MDNLLLDYYADPQDHRTECNAGAVAFHAYKDHTSWHNCHQALLASSDKTFERTLASDLERSFSCYVNPDAVWWPDCE